MKDEGAESQYSLHLSFYGAPSLYPFFEPFFLKLFLWIKEVRRTGLATFSPVLGRMPLPSFWYSFLSGKKLFFILELRNEHISPYIYIKVIFSRSACARSASKSSLSLRNCLISPKGKNSKIRFFSS